jgi:kynurenine 3-monooxygenase
MVKKVAIIRAGSSGLLLAHYLLRRGDKYQIAFMNGAAIPELSHSQNPESTPSP